MTPAQQILAKRRDEYLNQSEIFFEDKAFEVAAELYRRALMIDAILDEVRDAEKQSAA